MTYHWLEDGWDETSELIGRNMSLYLYKVPPLEYTLEDIRVEFQLMPLSGEAPKLYAKFCNSKDPKKCIEGIDRRSVEGN
jgi:hypothetical protein